MIFRRFARSPLAAACLLWTSLAIVSAHAQGAPPGPPAVGVVKVGKTAITETDSFIGRIQAVASVDIVARVTAFLDQVAFKDGAEVKRGDLLYRLERGPFEADLNAKQAVANQFEAQVLNANQTLDRAKSLLQSQAGTQATVDTAVATQKGAAAQLLGAQASVRQAQINLDYTLIASPIAGKLGRTAVTPGNVVSPSSGTLVTIVDQDPMYVTFPISVRTGLELRDRYASAGGFSAVRVRLRLPDGRLYGQIGKLEFADNRVQTATDTIILRATVANPPIAGDKIGGDAVRELVDGEFVSVVLEGVNPVEVLTAPRSAVLTDQQGDFVYVVGEGDKAERREVKLGQSTPTVASVISGLSEGETVVVDGLQRVRVGQPVKPGPAAATPPRADDAAAH